MDTQPIRQVSRMFYRDSLKAALARRVHPHTALHRKVLAHAIGRHIDTIDRIMAGEGAASFEVAGELARFFHSRGDVTFAYEAFGLPTAPAHPTTVPADRIRAVMEAAMRELVPA